MYQRHMTRLAVLVPLAVLLAGACDSASNGPFPTSLMPAALTSITVTSNPTTLAVGTTGQFVAVGHDATGAVFPLTATWSVVNSVAGTISNSGLFTSGTTVGSYVNTVKASSGTVSGMATVNVTASAPVLSSIIVTPNPSNPAVGATEQFVATGKDGAGNIIAMSAPTWSVVNGGGTIDAASGLFTAGNVAGTFAGTIKATSGTVSGFANVTVSNAGPVGPSLGTAAVYAVLGSTAVSCIGVTSVAGDVGVAPAGSVSGFPAPCVIAAPGAPSPHVNDASATTAQADVTPAYNALAGMPCGTALTGFDLGGMTLAPGVYCFTSSAQLTGILHLAGPANGLWVFQIATALTTGTSSQVVLSGGAQAKNVFWQVGTSATLGQTTIFRGNIVAAVSITMVQGSTLVGRALSKAGITMDGNTITLP